MPCPRPRACYAPRVRGSPATLPRAIFAYNHATWYVAEVLALASEYAQNYP